MADSKKIVVELTDSVDMRQALTGLIYDIAERVHDLDQRGMPFGGPDKVKSRKEAYLELAKAFAALGR